MMPLGDGALTETRTQERGGSRKRGERGRQERQGSLASH